MVNKIEEKLKEYRQRKEKERQAELRSQKPFWQRYLPESVIKLTEKKLKVNLEQPTPIQEEHKQQEDEHTLSDSEIRLRPKRRTIPETAPQEFSEIPEKCEAQSTPVTALEWVLMALKLVLWVILFKLSVEVEFGAVFIIFSLFYLILTNLRSSRRKPWEPSAYSVFNPGCEAIDGTLNAEQFEREIRHGL